MQKCDPELFLEYDPLHHESNEGQMQFGEYHSIEGQKGNFCANTSVVVIMNEINENNENKWKLHWLYYIYCRKV